MAHFVDKLVPCYRKYSDEQDPLLPLEDEVSEGVAAVENGFRELGVSSQAVRTSQPTFKPQPKTLVSKTRQTSTTPWEEKRSLREVFLPEKHFSTKSITPTISELCDGNSVVQLRKNKVRGAYSSSEQYLDTQFRLLREDLISGLKNGVARIRDVGTAVHGIKKLHDVKALYRNLTIVSPRFGQTGLTFFVELDMNEPLSKRICKGITKNLITGSFLCLTADDFCSNFLFAVIGECNPRMLKDKEGFEIIFLPDSFAMYRKMDNKTGPFLAVESEAYLEAYRHVLKGLQAMYAEGLPMERYIAFCETDIRSAEGRDTYQVLDADGSPVRELRTLLSDGQVSVDLSQELGLNISQYRAYVTALHQQLSIVHGPPGTGKTHVGLRIMRTLLYNLHDSDALRSRPFTERLGPILVICYTNHALDQFLEGILKFCDPADIVRVGGGSKSEQMKKCTFFEHKETTPTDLKDKYWLLSQDKEMYQKKYNGALYMVSSSSHTILPYNTPGLLEHARAYAQFSLWHRQENSPATKTRVNVMAVWLCCDVHSFSMLHPDLKEQQEPAAETIDMKTEADEERERRFIDDGEQQDENSPKVMGDEFVVKLTKKQKKQLRCHIKTQLAVTEMASAKEVKWIDNSDKSDIRELSLNKRWKLYRYWVSRFKSNLEQDILDDGAAYQRVIDSLTQIKVEMNASVMSRCKVIGMTTTGAAKYRDSLQIVGPKIVIAEEAAEVLEAHITTALTCHCEQLILIGDHKQLKPNPAVHDLAVKYHLNLSMFERLINNGLPHTTLDEQHRMRPEISMFVRNVYGCLDDHHSVHGREPMRGLASSVTFFDHRNLETADAEATSKSNTFEVEMVVGLVKFLVQQDYEPKDITVITMYIKQMFELKERLPKDTFDNLRVKSVDEFQGEENKIIILSLVRSNYQGVAGFVAIDNRVCVALSRARDGMFVFGNFNLLKRKSNLWAKVVADAEKAGVLQNCIKVTCPHRAQPALIKQPEDFVTKTPDGGCMKKCGEKLACGHICRLQCHYSHLNYQCHKRCRRRYANCAHHCKLLCYQECQPCQVGIQVTLPCTHVQRVACHKSTGDLTDIYCAVDCVETLKCGHQCRNKCSDQCTDKCMQKVQQVCSSCGKESTMVCHLAARHRLTLSYGGEFTCERKCDSILECGHRCAGLCSKCHGTTTKHQPCWEICGKELACGHRCCSRCSSCTSRGRCPPCGLLCVIDD